jgi:hypothetical protein
MRHVSAVKSVIAFEKICSTIYSRSISFTLYICHVVSNRANPLSILSIIYLINYTKFAFLSLARCLFFSSVKSKTIKTMIIKRKTREREREGKQQKKNKCRTLSICMYSTFLLKRSACHLSRKFPNGCDLRVFGEKIFNRSVYKGFVRFIPNCFMASICFTILNRFPVNCLLDNYLTMISLALERKNLR